MVDAVISQLQDVDRDSLHTLSLCILPFATPSLNHARLIKNAQLQSVVEFFEDKHTGSGQVSVDAVPMELDWPETPPHPDLIILRKLAQLNSFDCYSLRILFRQHEIEISDVEALKLSKSKRQELSEYMAAFTRPLIVEIFGGVDESIQSFDDILKLFRHPDIKEAREKLQTMADKLAIKVHDLPKFLEDYGDIYLSLSYYRQCLDLIVPIIEGFVDSLDNIRNSFQFKDNVNLMKTCDMMESTFERLETTITNRLETFERESTDLWDDISAERFKNVADQTRGHHTFIGGVLCALSVKMGAWSKLFPHASASGLPKRAEFILSEMKLGIEKFREIEAEELVVAALD